MVHSTSSAALKSESTSDLPHIPLNPVVYPIKIHKILLYTLSTPTIPIHFSSIISTIVFAVDEALPSRPLITSSSTRSPSFMRIKEKTNFDS